MTSFFPDINSKQIISVVEKLALLLSGRAGQVTLFIEEQVAVGEQQSLFSERNR